MDLKAFPTARNIYLVISLVCIVAIAFCIYYLYDSLGGFLELEIRELSEVEFGVVGKPFKGRYDDPHIEEFFITARDLITISDFPGDLCIVDYQNAVEEEDHVHLFIGLLLKEDAVQVPEEFQVREFEAVHALSTRLVMHPIVRPTKDEVEAMFYHHAREKGWELQDYFMEVNHQDNSVEVYGFVKSDSTRDHPMLNK